MKRFISGPVFKKTVATVVILVIAFFMGNQLYRSWQDIPFSSLHINYLWLLASYLGLFASFGCSIKAWQIILDGLGSRMNFTRSWWVITASLLAKYIPGHVWAVGGRILLCKAEGVSEKISGTAMIIEMMGLLLGSLLAGIACIPFLLAQGVPSWIWLMTLPAAILLLLLFSPLLIIILRWIARVLLKREVALTANPARFGAAAALYFASALIQGAAFFLLIRTIYPISPTYLPGAIGLYNGAWAVGFLSLITPGGLGVREGAMAFLLKYYIPVPLAVIISIMGRLWITIFEVMVALIGLRFRKQ
ncbi:flippase-like domain-containing protein [candidate division TA06 bacterium]|uniref:Flippase-like domain-containing protein n=1 Tax=candidate division TA06 bacterium TaxID=2250710 RepID=A0A933IF97_UNCT6|nr:flippase-like domain-containing protein [candidate division TA06 bacterium]